MDAIGDDISTKKKSSSSSTARSRKERNDIKIDNKQSTRRRRRLMKPSISEGLSEKQNSESPDFFHNNITEIPYFNPPSDDWYPNPATVGHVPCEGNNYFTCARPQYKHENIQCRKAIAKRLPKVNNGYEIVKRRALKIPSENISMKLIEAEMNELKVKLSNVVETLANVVEALVKTTGEIDKDNNIDFGVTEKTVKELDEGNRTSLRYDEDEIKSRNRGFCCFGSNNDKVKNTQSDSDYYRPEKKDHESKLDTNDDKKCIETSISQCQISGKNSDSKNRKPETQTCHRITICYFFQQLFNRAKLLFF